MNKPKKRRLKLTQTLTSISGILLLGLGLLDFEGIISLGSYGGLVGIIGAGLLAYNLTGIDLGSKDEAPVLPPKEPTSLVVDPQELKKSQPSEQKSSGNSKN